MSRPLRPDDMCPAYWPTLWGGAQATECDGTPSIECVGHEHCETPASEPHDHHDIVDHSGPWLRWCDHPLTCDREDCALSAASASKDARIRRT